MKKVIKITLFSILLVLSFYYTHKSAINIRNNDPIMKSILSYSNDYDTSYVDAKIDDNHIIPGMYGKKIDELKSLMKMKSEGVFNSIFLVTNDVKPKISIEDNKDKVISKGNEKKNSVSLILESNKNNNISYMKANNINVDVLIDKDSINNSLEEINNDFENYNSVEKYLNKNKKNTNICLVSRNNKDFCIRNKKYLIEPTYSLSLSNLLSIKNKVSSGDIILIKDNAVLDDIIYLINYIKSKGLNIINLSELISEK